MLLLVGLLSCLSLVFLTCCGPMTLLAVLPVAYYSLLLANYAACLRERDGAELDLSTAVGGFAAAAVTVLGLLLLIMLWDRSLSGFESFARFVAAIAFGACGIVLVALGPAYFRIEGIPLVPLQRKVPYDGPGRRVVIALMVVISASLLSLYLLFPYAFWERTPWITPEIEGTMTVDAGFDGAEWVAPPGSDLNILLYFHAGSGTAKGVSILLLAPDLEVINASREWTVREEAYLWRYTTIDSRVAEVLDITVRLPEMKGSRHEVLALYAYTNEEPKILDNKTIIASDRRPTFEPPPGSTGEAVGPFPVLVLLLVLVVIHRSRLR